LLRLEVGVTFIQKTMKKRNDPAFYRRNLPHIQPDNGVFMVTIRLYGSLPKEKVEQLKIEQELAKKELKNKGLSSDNFKKELKNLHQHYFGIYDHLLDNAQSGPTWLKQKPIVEIIKKSLFHFDGIRYKIAAFSIMSNHIHIITYKLDRRLFRILQSFKTYTGRLANIELNRTGNSFWAKENYDHLIENRSELAAKIWYVLQNPVKINLVKKWEEFPHNYLHSDFNKFLPKT